MIGYCRFCGERLEGPALRPADKDPERAAILGLGVVALAHLSKFHGNDAAVVGDGLMAIQCLVALCCIEGPPAMPATAPANDQANKALEYRKEFDRLRSDVCGWLNSEEPVKISRIVQPGKT